MGLFHGESRFIDADSQAPSFPLKWSYRSEPIDFFELAEGEAEILRQKMAEAYRAVGAQIADELDRGVVAND